MMLPELEQMLKFDEGIELRIYKDIVGKYTIGIGRNLEDKGISQKEALFLLNNDVEYIKGKLRKYNFYLKCNLARRMVLINMAFNMGIMGLLNFKKTLGYINEEKYDEAAKEMLNSHWARQVPNRAKRLADVMKTGEFDINHYKNFGTHNE